eukprot:jgi/Botrbrau1/453/Bobra.110_2s0099.1
MARSSSELSDTNIDIVTWQVKKFNLAIEKKCEFTIVQGDILDAYSLKGKMIGSNVLIIATGPRFPELWTPLTVDHLGTQNLVKEGNAAKIKRIVLISCVGAGDLFSPVNLFGLVRHNCGQLLVPVNNSLRLPFGNKAPKGPSGGQESIIQSYEQVSFLMTRGHRGRLVSLPKDSFLRSLVANVAVEALIIPAATNMVIEVAADPTAPDLPIADLFQKSRR